MTKATGKRPFTTDYGVTKGHCETPQGAVRSAIVHLIKSGQRRCVIERPEGVPVDVWYDGYFGVIVSPRKRARKSAQVLMFPKKRRA